LARSLAEKDQLFALVKEKARAKPLEKERLLVKETLFEKATESASASKSP
jgi:hypothetical protein